MTRAITRRPAGRRTKKAADVGRLTALVAQADGDARRAQDRAELAVERYNKAVVDLGTATAKATAAKAAGHEVGQGGRGGQGGLRRVRPPVATCRAARSTRPTAALLDADSPTDLLQRADLLGYAGKHKLDVMGQLERANVKRANAESTARQLLAAQKAATARAETLKIAAAREVAAARAKLAVAADPEGDAQPAAGGGPDQAQRAVRGARPLPRLEEGAGGGGGPRGGPAAGAARGRGGPGGGSRRRGGRGRPAAVQLVEGVGSSRLLSEQQPSRSACRRWTGGGGWSASKGQRVADLAMQWLGTPYSWGGGNSSGPTWGTGGPVGFDCSGLALWAWAQVGVYAAALLRLPVPVRACTSPAAT